MNHLLCITYATLLSPPLNIIFDLKHARLFAKLKVNPFFLHHFMLHFSKSLFPFISFHFHLRVRTDSTEVELHIVPQSKNSLYPYFKCRTRLIHASLLTKTRLNFFFTILTLMPTLLFHFQISLIFVSKCFSI
jgi:hypothetical protein